MFSSSTLRVAAPELPSSRAVVDVGFDGDGGNPSKNVSKQGDPSKSVFLPGGLRVNMMGACQNRNRPPYSMG